MSRKLLPDVPGLPSAGLAGLAAGFPGESDEAKAAADKLMKSAGMDTDSSKPTAWESSEGISEELSVATSLSELTAQERFGKGPMYVLLAIYVLCLPFTTWFIFVGWAIEMRSYVNMIITAHVACSLTIALGTSLNVPHTTLAILAVIATVPSIYFKSYKGNIVVRIWALYLALEILIATLPYNFTHSLLASFHLPLPFTRAFVPLILATVLALLLASKRTHLLDASATAFGSAVCTVSAISAIRDFFGTPSPYHTGKILTHPHLLPVVIGRDSLISAFLLGGVGVHWLREYQRTNFGKKT